MSGHNGHQGKSFEKITTALHAHNRTVKFAGDYKAIAQCPAHEDGNPSLGITWSGGDNPLTLMHCFAGCDNQDIMAALELRISDLYDNAGPATYSYTNPDSGWGERYVHRDTETKAFTQSIKKKTDKTPLYRRDLLRKARADSKTVYLVEGEKDADALIYLGETATTAPMGAGNFDKCDIAELVGLPVVAIADSDDAGRAWARQVYHHLGKQAKLLRFKRAAAGKDVSDHIAAQLLLTELADVPDGFPYENGDTPPHEKKGRFTVRTFTDIQPRASTWLLDGVLPDDDLTVFIGEEGIGKGLFAADVITRVTKAGHNVLIIATEDDFERVPRPRLDVAGADISRCIAMLADPDTLQGQPNLPHNRLEVEAVINEYKVRLVYIDPWVSSVSGGLRLQNTQDARSAIDPLLSMARASHCSVLAVAHPNRGEGDLRARVGLSAVLRQAARLLLFAIEPPDDDTKLIIGIEKANETGRAPASVYRKLPKKHPTLAKPVWAVEEITDAPRLTIRQWHDQYRTDRDHRRSDRWPSVLAAAKNGLVQRADIIAIYEESGSDQGAADKAINRWLKAGRLVKQGNGIYEFENG